MPRSSSSYSSEDSDKGIRYKTESIRKKTVTTSSSSIKNQSGEKRKYSRRKSDSSSSEDEEYRRHRKRKEIKHRLKRERRQESRDRHKDKSQSCVSIHSVSNTDQIGPSLPPHLVKSPDSIAISTEIKSEKSSQICQQSTFGPSLPPNLKQDTSTSPSINQTESSISLEPSIGTVLPPHLSKIESDPIKLEGSNRKKKMVSDMIGPALPPHLQKSHVEDPQEQEKEQSSDVIIPKVIGPALPPHLQKESKTDDNEENEDEEKERVIGPTLPPHLKQQLADAVPCIAQQDLDDDETYGPLPVGAALSKSHVELEERALQMKIDQLNPQGDDEPKRETWMLELPKVRAANLGLGPRTFRTKEGPDFSDRSSWTDTPEDKARKKDNTVKEIDIHKEAELKLVKKRDKEQEEQVKKSKRTKDSLLDIHRKKLKEKKADGATSTERRPFSRDIDLQVNRFDEAQKKAILKKSQLLDDRFSSGQSKYL